MSPAFSRASSSLQEISLGQTFRIIFQALKALFEELLSSLDKFYASIDWAGARAKVCHFAVTSWKTIEGAKLLSHQKLAGYAILFSCRYPLLFPVVAVFIFFIQSILAALLFLVLSCVGFSRGGIHASSLASSYQAHTYGATTPAGSHFSGFQSMGARGSIGGSAANALNILIRVAAGSLGIYLVIDDFVRQSA